MFQNIESPNQSVEATAGSIPPLIRNLMEFWLHYKMPFTAFDELLQILRNVPSLALDTALQRRFSDYVKSAAQEIDVQFFIECGHCGGYQSHLLTEGSLSQSCCQECNAALRGKSYFIYLGLEKQLKGYLEKYSKEILEYRQEIIRKYESDSNTIADVWSGEMLRNIVEQRNNRMILSLAINTDGASIAKANQMSIWPIQVCMNFLPPSMRYKNENILTIALYVGHEAPDMNVYFYPFVTEYRNLKASPILFKYKDEEFIAEPVLTQCVLDLQAKTKLQGIRPHSSFESCTYCWHPGKSVMNRDNINKYVRYVSEGTPYPYRTHQDTIQTMMDLKGKPIDGVYKLSCMAAVNDFDVIFSFSIDYMHGALGVVKTLMNLWFSPKNAAQKFYSPPRRQVIIDKKLMCAKPSSFGNKPRSIGDLKKYKAKDFRCFLLYYGYPCLRDSFSTQQLNHFQLLSSAIYILLQTSISEEDLIVADAKLRKFVSVFDQIYSEKKTTMNIHLLTHLTHVVRKLGPLWCQSAFFFESNNGCLIKSIKGPTDILPQIAKKYILKQNTTNINDSNGISRITVSDKFKRMENVPKFDEWSRIFNVPVATQFYKTMKIARSKYTSVSYKRATKTCNYFVSAGSVAGAILCYFRDRGDTYAIVQQYASSDSIDQFHKVFAIEEYHKINTKDILFKYMHIQIGISNEYLVEPPNSVEIF